jgi:hypothetical protein
VTNTPQQQHAKLRAITREMLGLDGDDLSPLQNLQVDVISVLLLELDTLQGQQLAGQQVDMPRLSSAIALLHKMLPATPLAAPVEVDFEARYNARVQEEFAGAREKFSNLMADHHERHQRALRSDNPVVREAALRTLSPAVNAIIAELEAEIERLRTEIVERTPQAAPPPTPTPTPPSPEQTTSPPPPPNVVPMRNVPEHYLARPREAWRDFVRPDGSIGGPGDRWSNKG